MLCVAGRGSLDEAAAAMLAQLLEKHGIGARVVPSEAVSVANLPRLDVTGVQMACLSCLEPSSFTNARYLVRRLRRRLPQAKIVDGFWTLTAQEAEERDALAATRADLVVTSLRQAVEQVVNAAKEAANADLEGELERPPSHPQRRVIQSWNFLLYSINLSVPNPCMKNPPLPIISARPPRRLVEVLVRKTSRARTRW